MFDGKYHIPVWFEEDKILSHPHSECIVEDWIKVQREKTDREIMIILKPSVTPEVESECIGSKNNLGYRNVHRILQ